MTIRNFLLFALVAALALGLAVYTRHQQTATQPAQTLAVANLFAQTMPDAAGKPQALAQWKGRPLIINFWATWCAPCVEEIPELAALQAEVAPVQIIGIGVDSQENIARFAEKFHIFYPLYVAGTGATDMLHQFDNQSGGLPFTVLVGLDGNVKKVYLGQLNFDELRRDLTSLKNM